jgi:tyrosyl-tRNA synthetase
MSKSLGNYIGVAEPPNDIYGKVMSITDDLIMNYFELLTDVPDKELEELRQALTKEAVNPMVLKKRLGRELVTQLYSPKEAAEAEAHFEKVFQKREVPDQIPEYHLPQYCYTVSPLPEVGVDVPHVPAAATMIDVPLALAATAQVNSRSEGKRLIDQGAVELDGKKITSNAVPVKKGTTVVVKIGKHRFVKIVID